MALKYKALRIPEEAYSNLEELKDIEIEAAEKAGENDKIMMLAAMGLGAFAGYLIYKMAKDNQF